MSPRLARLAPFLCLLFTGTVSSAMIIPFMPFFLVEGLGHDPWVISLYSLFAISLTVTANNRFARRIDSGQAIFPLIGVACAGYLLAASTLSITATIWTVMTFGVLGFGLSSSAVSSMFTLGGRLAEEMAVDRVRFNAYMRATTSTAWMIGPALTFLVADRFGPPAVFRMALAIGALWLVLWWLVLPRDITSDRKTATLPTGAASRALRTAAGFVFCLAFAHSLTFSALPLFFVREVGLPGYAPGLAFSVKTFCEVFAIFSTPFLVARFGPKRPLLATSALAVIAILVLSGVSSLPQMFAGAALEGVYYGLFASMGISFIQSLGSDRPARATAVYWNTIMISSLLAGPAAGLIAQFRDFHTVVLCSAGVAVAAFVVLLLSPAPRSDS